MADSSSSTRPSNRKGLLTTDRRRFMNQFVATSLGPSVPALASQSRGIRPRIALALGTGSIHGIVHIGVLKACEQLGFKPDLITGSSAGAIVGALWAAGLRSSSLRLMAEQVGWWDVASFPSSLTGLASNQQLAQLVERETKGKRIEELSIPFCAVATDLATGQRALLSEGATGNAVAASCSMPVLFEPVDVGGRALVDGALTEPVPVQAARDLGATHILAVDVQYRPYEGSVGRIISIGFQSMRILVASLTEAQIRGSDLAIRLDVHSLMDKKPFADALISAGEQAFAEIWPSLKRWKV